MVELKFMHSPNPYAIGFTREQDLDTIYIPTGVLKQVSRYFRRIHGLSLKQAQQAAELYLEEIYPQILSHEASHLALGHIAQEEGLPLRQIKKTMLGYHNPIVKEIEDETYEPAKIRALEKAQEAYRNLQGET